MNINYCICPKGQATWNHLQISRLRLWLSTLQRKKSLQPSCSLPFLGWLSDCYRIHLHKVSKLPPAHKKISRCFISIVFPTSVNHTIQVVSLFLKRLNFRFVSYIDIYDLKKKKSNFNTLSQVQVQLRKKVHLKF